MHRMMPKADVLNVGITLGDPDQMISEIGRWIRERGPARTLAAVNVHTFMEAQRSPRYRQALNDAAIAFVDGVPIRWLMKSSGIPPPPRIHGADFMAAALERLPDARHLFYGSTSETLERLTERLGKRYPGLRVAGTISPPFRKTAVEENAETLQKLNSSQADILWVALGAPKQELWALLNRPGLSIPVVACVGAAFEIHAGRFDRAPQRLQKMGLEWAWRLRQDPARLWRRYFTTNGGFLTLLLRESSKRLFRSTRPARSSTGS
jgi:N-acetylglucosaminyldiphosphoundecaprenol N-acetyl-beta-D-mannosaminyltransferase